MKVNLANWSAVKKQMDNIEIKKQIKIVYQWCEKGLQLPLTHLNPRWVGTFQL